MNDIRDNPSSEDLSTAGQNHQMSSRRNYLSASGTVIAVGIAGCMGGGDGGEIHFLMGESHDSAVEFFERVIDEFEEDSGHSVNLEFGADEQRIIQLIQAGDPPEVADAGDSELIGYAAQNQLEPINDVVETAEENGGELLEQAKVNYEGDEFMLPLYINSALYNYREDLLGEDHVEPDTWETAIEYARRVDEETDVRGHYLPARRDRHATFHYIGWATTNDAHLVSRESGRDPTEIRVDMHEGENRERWVETINHLNELYQYSPEATDSDWSTIYNSLASEQAASFYYAGARAIEIVVDQQPDWAEHTRIAPMPEGQNRISKGNSDGLMLFSGSDNVEAGRELLEFFSQREYLEEAPFAVAPIHYYSPFTEIVDSDSYQETLFTFADPENGLTEEELTMYHEDIGANFYTSVSETEPPLPYNIDSSLQISDFVIDSLVNNEDPDQTIDEYAEALQDDIDNTL